MTSYQEFLARKALTPILAGYNDDPAPHPAMFPHQIDAFRFMARVGRGAAFLETGLGIAGTALGEDRIRSRRPAGADLRPLAVAQQFVREGRSSAYPVATSAIGMS